MILIRAAFGTLLLAVATMIVALTELACSPIGPHREVPPMGATIGGGPGQQGASAQGVGYDQLKPIFQVCAHCHPALSKPNWLDYSQARQFALNGLLNRRFVVEQSMPPRGTPEAMSITPEQRQLVGRWIQEGAPQTAPSATAVKGQPPAPVAASQVQGPAVVQACFACHGTDGLGMSGQGHIPRLAGLSEDYIRAQLVDFKWRLRIDPSGTMNQQATGLSDDDMHVAAHYFSTRPSFSSQALPVQTANRGAEAPIAPNEATKWKIGKAAFAARCLACHGSPESAPAMQQAPLLQNQQRDYIFSELIMFRNGTRQNPIMNAIAGTLKDADIEAISLYLSDPDAK